MMEDYWVNKVLMDHLSGTWVSLYIKFINWNRYMIGIFDGPHSTSMLTNLVADWFIGDLNHSIADFSLL